MAREGQGGGPGRSLEGHETFDKGDDKGRRLRPSTDWGSLDSSSSSSRVMAPARVNKGIIMRCRGIDLCYPSTKLSATLSHITAASAAVAAAAAAAAVFLS